MELKPLLTNQQNDDKPLSVVDMRISVLAGKHQTNGQEFTYQSGGEGMGPPPHSHDWDASFFIISGSVEIIAGDIAATCTPGTLAYVPGGTIHSFKFGAGGGEMLEITGSGSRAVAMFTDLGKEIPNGPPEIEKVVEVMARNGATVHV